MLANPWQPQGTVIPASGSTFWPAQPNVFYEGNSQLGLSGNVFKLWYFNNASPYGMYYAESSDHETWVEAPGNPILASVSLGKIFKSGSTYYLYANVDQSGSAIAAYTSPDGVDWTLANASALTPTQAWEADGVFQLAVAGQVGGTFYGYYSGNLNEGSYQAGQVTSTDLVHWTKTGTSPVSSLSQGNFSSGGAWLGEGGFNFLEVNGAYYVWGQIFPSGTPGADADAASPLDMGRWSAPSPAGPWTFSGVTTYQRTLPSEGITSGATVNTNLGQIGDPAIVEVSGTTYMFYTGVVNGVTFAGGLCVNLAIVNLPLSTLVRTSEGIQNIPIPFPGATASLNFGTLATDNFVRASLGPDWTSSFVGSGHAAAQIVSDLVESTTISDDASSFYNAISWPDDQWAQDVVRAFSADNSQVGVTLRVAEDASGSYYRFVLYAASGGAGSANQSVYITRSSGGAQTAVLGEFSTVTPELGDVITASAVEGQLSLFYNGYLVLTVLDSTLASGAPGFTVLPATAVGNAALNGWAGGNANVIPAYPSSGAIVVPIIQ
jgi:hypothetical protein